MEVSLGELVGRLGGELLGDPDVMRQADRHP
jgi:hypothetical protein